MIDPQPSVKDKRLLSPEPEKPKRGGKPDAEQPDSPFRLPCWSVLLTLMLTFGAVGCVVALVLAVGGRTIPPMAAPQFVILTAVPTQTVVITIPALVASPTLPADLQASAQVVVVLAGPTLPPIIFTPTPTPPPQIEIGATVIVVGDRGINIRNNPGLETARVDIADPGETFRVIGGPQDANGLKWWQIQDASGISGWVAENDGTGDLIQAVTP